MREARGWGGQGTRGKRCLSPKLAQRAAPGVLPRVGERAGAPLLLLFALGWAGFQRMEERELGLGGLSSQRRRVQKTVGRTQDTCPPMGGRAR